MHSNNTFQFRLSSGGQLVAGVCRVSGLKQMTEVTEIRDVNSNVFILPGRTRFAPITIERGITQDRAFADWAAQVYSGSPPDFRKDLRLELLNETGAAVLAYQIFRCWPSEFQALPELDAEGGAIAFEKLVLENEGWVREP